MSFSSLIVLQNVISVLNNNCLEGIELRCSSTSKTQTMKQLQCFVSIVQQMAKVLLYDNRNGVGSDKSGCQKMDWATGVGSWHFKSQTTAKNWEVKHATAAANRRKIIIWN